MGSSGYGLQWIWVAKVAKKTLFPTLFPQQNTLVAMRITHTQTLLPYYSNLNKPKI
jgi:hypothetical protein